MRLTIRNQRLFAAFLAVMVGLLLPSCETNRWFQSEDSLNAKIQSTWNKIKINPNTWEEQWIFTEGKVYRFLGSPLAPSDIDTGNYSVSTSVNKAYLTIDGFNRIQDELNAKWEILELNGGILFIATDHDGSSGLRQLEFSEK